MRDYLERITACRNGGQVTRKYANEAEERMKNYRTMLKMYDAISAGEDVLLMCLFVIICSNPTFLLAGEQIKAAGKARNNSSGEGQRREGL